jgi:hypothetical protein
MRWSIEQCFKECKSFLGMDQYETRSWIGWRRQILLTLISHLFLLKLRLQCTTKKDHPLLAPIVTEPVPLDEFLEADEKNQNNEPVNHPSIQVVAKAPQAFLTLGIIRYLINMSIMKNEYSFNILFHKIKNIIDSFNSYSRTRVKEKRTQRTLSLVT